MFVGLEEPHKVAANGEEFRNADIVVVGLDTASQYVPQSGHR
jgi:hypothetical protein